jgi:hypothetical protein
MAVKGNNQLVSNKLPLGLKHCLRYRWYKAMRAAKSAIVDQGKNDGPAEPHRRRQETIESPAAQAIYARQ